MEDSSSLGSSRDDDSDHPFHQHKLDICDPVSVHGHLVDEWVCNVCELPFSVRSVGRKTNNNMYHCHKCAFDMCSDCYRGYLHPFHEHRLQPASPQMCYPHTKGLWRCDVCFQIYSPLNTQYTTDMYHCSRCQLDLCDTCFKGEWRHVSHIDKTHQLKPIDPRIHHRLHENWICDVCGETGEHSDEFTPYLTCDTCDTDMCIKCFRGAKHHSHQHTMVPASQYQTTTLNKCHECGQQLSTDSYHLCRFPDCSYYLCQTCFDAPPQPHPIHPDHILYVSDPLLVYPETTGTWRCDSCAKQYSPKDTNKEIMHHCDKCSFDLCGSCHDRTIYKTTPTSAQSRVSSQRTYISGRNEYHRPTHVPSSNSLQYIPSLPATTSNDNHKPKLCSKCGLHVARLTPVHMGRPHPMAVYCMSCATIALQTKESCTVCGNIAEDMKEVY